MGHREFSTNETILINRYMERGARDYWIASKMHTTEKEIYLYRWLIWGGLTPERVLKFCFENQIVHPLNYEVHTSL